MTRHHHNSLRFLCLFAAGLALATGLPGCKKQLNDQEDRLEALKKETKQLESQAEAAQDKLAEMIQDLSFDVKM